MKKLILAAALLVGSSAFAADICQDYFACGAWTNTWYQKINGKNTKSVTTVTITATGQNTAEFTYKTSVGGGTPGGWDLFVTFDDQGSFTMVEKNKDGSTTPYANGICYQRICSYGMHPWLPEGEKSVIGNAGILSFPANKLELAMMVGTPSNTRKTLQVFASTSK